MNRFRKHDRRQVFTLVDISELQIKHFRITQKRDIQSGTFIPIDWDNDKSMKCFTTKDIDDLTL